MGHLLSKSKYIRGLQCDRALWLDVYNPRLAKYTREQMQRFDRGREYEYAFMDTFPNGIDISAEVKRNVDAYPELTAMYLNKEEEVDLFEAGFLYDDVLVLADVVHKNEDSTLDIYEVKSGTTLSETYKRDAALQHYVISHCRHINKFCVVYNGDNRFDTIDLTEELAAQHDEIAHNIAIMKSILQGTNEPDTPTGQHCVTPYECPYQAHCRSGVRQLALF